ncbi:hypothetical protein K492DRAFT_120979, partial [Lichtheimia hyalospora FSU 10163]
QGNGCLSLEGSKACPAYSRYYVPLINIGDRYPFLANVIDIASFDQALYNYVQSSEYYMDRLGCHSEQRVPYARYSLTRLCTMVIHDVPYASPHCNANHAVAPVPPLCQRTCQAWVSSIGQLTNNRCFNGLVSGGSVMDYEFMEQCMVLPRYNSTADNCISGQENEPDNCG